MGNEHSKYSEYVLKYSQPRYLFIMYLFHLFTSNLCVSLASLGLSEYSGFAKEACKNFPNCRANFKQRYSSIFLLWFSQLLRDKEGTLPTLKECNPPKLWLGPPETSREGTFPLFSDRNSAQQWKRRKERLPHVLDDNVTANGKTRALVWLESIGAGCSSSGSAYERDHQSPAHQCDPPGLWG